MNIDAMFTNDIVGGVTTRKTMPNRNKVRVFSEGSRADETAAEARTRQSVGGENRRRPRGSLPDISRSRRTNTLNRLISVHG